MNRLNRHMSPKLRKADNMDQPILSIISPVLNGAQYLPTFIQAVIDQQCSKIEHIIVDGAADDGSVKIIKEYAGKYPHIRWLSEKDSGPEEAINKGLALARGTFVTILCLDDFYEPNTLNDVTALLLSLPQPVFLVGNCNILNAKDELLSLNKPEALTSLGIMLKKPFPHNPSAYFYHKDLHKTVGPYYLGHQSDVDFLLRAFNAAKVHYVDQCWGNYRIMPGSVTDKLVQAGLLDSGLDKIFKRHLKTYPFFRRVFVWTALRLNKNPRLMYYIERLIHYLRDPKDVVGYFQRRYRMPSEK